MLPSKTVQIVLAGKEYSLEYSLGALRVLGLKGPLDGEGWDALVVAAGNDFSSDALARMIYAGLWRDKDKPLMADIGSEVNQWSAAEVVRVLKEMSEAAFGELTPNGAGDTRPIEAQTGSSAGPAPSSSSDSAIAASGD